MNFDGSFFDRCAADHDLSFRQHGDSSAQKQRYECHFFEILQGNLYCDLRALTLTETDRLIMEVANLSSFRNEKSNSFGLAT